MGFRFSSLGENNVLGGFMVLTENDIYKISMGSFRSLNDHSHPFYLKLSD